MADGYNLHSNRQASRRGRLPVSGLSPAEFEAAREEISSWPNYRPTPLVSLSGLARASEIASLWYKDEGTRFGLGSFKALGGAYATGRLLQSKIAENAGRVPSFAELRSGMFRDFTRNMKIVTATDGNHGRSVAWGARMFHCPCVVYVPRLCSRNRELAIASYGAVVVRSTSGYDETVNECAHDANENGWLLVSDTSWDGYEQVPGWVMQGYTMMSSEVMEQLGPDAPPTHVFVQGGCGGLAAAVCAHFESVWRARAPRFIVVEPLGAACLYASAVAGEPTALHEESHTIMAGLDCGHVSALAWKILFHGADFFMMIPDSTVPDCLRLLAFPPFGDAPIVSGESAIAGLAALLYALRNSKVRSRLGLCSKSKVLLFGTEGDTDPDRYRELTGVSAADIRARAAAFE